jgi:hypothetical protein
MNALQAIVDLVGQTSSLVVGIPMLGLGAWSIKELISIRERLQKIETILGMCPVCTRHKPDKDA